MDRPLTATTRCDVAVVGAGPGGSAAAFFLARAGLDVLLLDRATFPRDKTCGDGLTPQATAIASEMGALDELLASGHRVTEFEVVAPGGRTVSTPIPSRAGAVALVVPRLVMDDVLRRRAVAAGARFEGGIDVAQLSVDGAGVRVLGRRSGEPVEVRATLVLVATGANMGLLERAGLLPRRPQVAVAARAYLEAAAPADRRLSLRFDGVPLPGYGWVFPLSPTTVNVGAGYLRRPGSASAPRALEGFLATPRIRSALDGARQVGPTKSFPIRTDFATAPTYGRRVLLVGEAAGLVNPLSGEGIHYAMESGRLASECAVRMLERGDFSPALHAEYDQSLRQRFQDVFETCVLFRDLFMRRMALDALAWLGAHRRGLGSRLADLVLEDHRNSERRTALGRVRSWILG